MTRRQAIDQTLRLVRSPDARLSLTRQAGQAEFTDLSRRVQALTRQQLRAMNCPVGLRNR